MTRTLTHGRVQLALHELRGGAGRPLLLLHALGQSSPTTVPSEVEGWAGPVLALDFTGHGASTVPAGGGYSPEVLMADADAVLTEVGEVTVVGHGLGGYVALLLAGSRPALVHGAVICDGAGLTGGGQTPPPPRVTVAESSERTAPDPLALAELSGDVRPPDYAVLFARMAVEGSSLETPITVAALERPRWLLEVMAEAGVARGTVADGLERYAK
jgi:pimeloyl-ACP methyl ester carboxylesterase